MRTLMVPFGSSIIPRQKRQGRRFPFGFFPLRGFRRLRRTVADVMCPSASSKDQILRQDQQLPHRLLRRLIYFIIFSRLMSYCIFCRRRVGLRGCRVERDAPWGTPAPSSNRTCSFPAYGSPYGTRDVSLPPPLKPM